MKVFAVHQQNTHAVSVFRTETQVGPHTITVTQITKVGLTIDGAPYSSKNGKIQWLGYDIETRVKSHDEVELFIPLKLAKQLGLLKPVAV